MKRGTTVRSPGAIALGTACALGTLIVLFWYVRAPTDFTVNHLYILLALVVAYGSGHFMWDAFGEGLRGLVRGLAMTVLFLVGTAICVGLSGGRSAEVFEHIAAATSLQNGKRLAHEAKIAEANVERRKAKDAYAAAAGKQTEAEQAQHKACVDGDGNRCKGAKVTMATAQITAQEALRRQEQADAHYWQLVAQLGNMKPEQVANANLKQIAKLWALYSGDEKRAVEIIMLLMPYALALLTEFGSIVFFKHGFGRAETQRQQAGGRDRETVHPGPGTVSPTPGPGKPSRFPETGTRKPSATVLQLPFKGPRKPLSKAETLAFVQAEITQRGSIPSQDAIVAQCGRRKGTVSRWLRDWEHSGLISRQQDGRCKVVASA